MGFACITSQCIFVSRLRKVSTIVSNGGNDEDASSHAFYGGFGTPDLRNGFPHFDFLFYFITHGLIIVSVIYATVLFKYRPTLKSIWRTFFATISYGLVILPVNWLLNTNYLYLSRKPQNPSLLDYLVIDRKLARRRPRRAFSFSALRLRVPSARRRRASLSEFSVNHYLGPRPWYILILVVVSLIIFFISSSPFWIADLIRKRRQ